MQSPDFSTLALERDQPLQSQLHQKLVEWICIGRLQPGTKLLSSRKLSDELGVSRNTVTLVIEQLKSEGFLQSAQGKGVFVSEQLPSHVNKPDSASWLKQTPLPKLSSFAKYLSDQSTHQIDVSLPFTPGVPDLENFPKKTWSNIYRTHQNRPLLLAYGGSQGLPELREALAHYLQISRGVRCDASQIIITNGAQEALSLCALVSLDKGDTALIENPGYKRVQQAFRSRQVKLHPVPLKNNYINIDKLKKSKVNAKVLYTTPTHQYPLGGIMPASERIQLLDWAAASNTWILEDDYDSEYSFKQKPVASLQGMADNTPVLYMGSFSKTLFPALRMGYLVVPKKLVHIFIQAKSHLSGETCLVNQATTADFISEGHFVRHLRRMRNVYKDKWEHFHTLIDKQLSPYAKPIGQRAGMHIVLETPGIDDQTLRLNLMNKGFGGSSLSDYYLNKAEKHGLVLGFANTTETQQIQIIKALKAQLSTN